MGHLLLSRHSPDSSSPTETSCLLTTWQHFVTTSQDMLLPHLVHSLQCLFLICLISNSSGLPQQCWLYLSRFASGYLFPQEIPHHLETLDFPSYNIKLMVINSFLFSIYILERLQKAAQRETSWESCSNCLYTLPQLFGCDYYSVFLCRDIQRNVWKLQDLNSSAQLFVSTARYLLSFCPAVQHNLNL